ncbi:MAG: hypothetical protein AAGA85_06270, partial [Bacteroidota bacterium]
PGVLVIQGRATDPRNGNFKESPKLQVATGIITTSLAVMDSYTAAYADHGYNDQEELEPTNVDFFFPQGVSRLVTSVRTDGTSNLQKRNDLSVFIADKNVTRTVTITGTHSPEGTERINSGLSQDRAETIENYYRSQMRRYDYQGVADSIDFILKPVVESWSEFRTALRGYDGIEDGVKNEYLRIIDGSGSFEDKEKQLQKIGSYRKVFNDIYPQLRTAKTEILTVKEKKSNAEIAVLSKQVASGSVSADTLESNELLFGGTLTPSIDEKISIYAASTKKDGSWQAHNNLAAAHLDKARMGMGNKNQLVEDALTQLEIAANKNDAAEVHANIASAYMMQGEYEKAYESITAAMGKGPNNQLAAEINAMKGAVEIRTGQYDAAKVSLASAGASDVVSFDRGLAHLLSKDFTAADTFFGEAAESKEIGAHANYYRAVAAARRNSPTDVTSYLLMAVQAEPSLKEKALADLEFTNYANAVSEAVK